MDERRDQRGGRRAAYRLMLFAACLGAVSYFVWRNAGRLAASGLRFDASLVALSLGCVIAAYLARFLSWTALASLFSLRAPLLPAGRAYFLSVLGRYIPGKVGLALVRIEGYRGHPASLVVLATGVEMLTALSAGLVLMCVGILFLPPGVPAWLRWAAPAGIALIALLLSPPLFHRAARAALRLTGSAEPPILPRFGAMLGLIGLYLLPGLLQGLGLYTLLLSLGPVPAGSYLAVTGAYYTAGIAGMLAVFAPGGIGVREGILMLVLPVIVPRETAIAASLAIRLVMVAAELLLAGVFALAARRRGA